jgi:NitT/TauT family transport system ATP-binding protein
MVAAPPIVKFSRATKRYGAGPVVLQDLNLDVAPGDFITLIGPSGCGKSTVLKLVSGLSPLTAGEVVVAGRPRARRATGRPSFSRTRRCCRG